MAKRTGSRTIPFFDNTEEETLLLLLLFLLVEIECPPVVIGGVWVEKVQEEKIPLSPWYGSVNEEGTGIRRFKGMVRYPREKKDTNKRFGDDNNTEDDDDEETL